MIRLFTILTLLILTTSALGQKNVTTFGIQFKPIIPSKYFETNDQTFSQNNIDLTLSPKVGYVFGMVIRQGFTKNLSLETGINIIRRNYSINTTDKNYNTSLELDFSLVGYEIPVKGLFYVQLGEELWMNAAGGMSFDFYPSNIFSNSFDSRGALDYNLDQNTYRNSWLQLGVIANLGFEYRTKDIGYFYLGGSFHQPFTDIALTRAEYEIDGVGEVFEFWLSGTYLTLDLRYFFNEKPERRRK